MLIIPSLSSKRHNCFTGMVTLNPGTTPVFTLTSGRSGLFRTPLENLYWYGLKPEKKSQILLLIKSTEDWTWSVFIINYTPSENAIQ